MTIHDLPARFPELVFEENVTLAAHTYMKVGGPAALFTSVKTRDQLFSLCSTCIHENLPFVVIGGASNVVIPDEGLQKLVIKNQTSEIEMTAVDATHVAVRVDSGVVTAVAANRTMEQGLSGLEYFIGVPGSIGGAIVNNSHFTAHELIGNLVTEVEVCTKEGNRETWPKDRLKFAYDYSIFHEELGVVLSAVFLLTKDTPQAITERVKLAATKRTQTQPIGIPSSGCMFKNPEVDAGDLERLRTIFTIPEGAIKELAPGKWTIAAGFLIDQAGLKGTAIGGAVVSDKHATYILNTGNATAKDVDALATKVEQIVSEKYGISLVREVFFLK